MEGEQRDIAHLIIRELCLHLHRKILVLYPLIAERMENGIDISSKCRLEQSVIEGELAECEKCPEQSNEYREKLMRALFLFQELNTYEETQVFPLLEKCVSTDEAVQKAKEYQALIASVGTRPHPNCSTELPRAFVEQHADSVYDHMADKGRFGTTKGKLESQETRKGEEYLGEPSKDQNQFLLR
jgi:hypothetical protein